jgi:alkylation response protein AidB-like acyl-CoA dehydrogenase
MPEYKAPIRDMQFAMFEVLDFPAHYAALPGYEEATRETIDAILPEAARFAEEVAAPLNQVGDNEGCHFDNGIVTTPEGFKSAYQQFTENGWAGLSQSAELGGMGLPYSLNNVCYEMLATANHAWSMYPSLIWGAMTTIEAHGTEELKERYLLKMANGEWAGTMCLTEAHCGSDLGLLRTQATPAENGSYKINGSKMFISAGDHDLTDNIVHIVLARLPDAPVGVKGISLFLVPKIRVRDDGVLGDSNGVSCGSIEHKMGIHGNATCVINFDQSEGFLLGQPHKGMSHMFTFINESRLGVAQQAHAHIEGSFQTAYRYAMERIQMRAPTRHSPDKPADPIIAHPDVRRMLLTQKAFNEGARLLNYYCSVLVDIKQDSADEDQRKQAETLLAFLTPVAKAFISEISIECTSLGVQLLGGHGYVQEWGQEQHSRDTRITALYEGTTGIQGLDLLGRKILGSGGTIIEPFVAMVRAFCDEHPDSEWTKHARNALQDWLKTTDTLVKATMANPDEINAGAYDYLMSTGYMVMAYIWARAAIVASTALERDDPDADFYRAKLSTARFYFERLLPRTLSMAASLQSGADNLTELPEAHFIF